MQSPWDMMGGAPQQQPYQAMPPMPMQQPMQQPPMGPQDFQNTGGEGMFQQVEQKMTEGKDYMSDISLEQAQLKHTKDKLGMEVGLMQKLMGQMKGGM